KKKTLLYDKSGEEHYNLISALHKSLRDSDPDAALYWLTRMLEAGEDRLYIARRLVRFASEDVGNADPQALLLTLAAKEAYDFLGDPEGELALAQATLYLALAPKSNAVYVAYDAAQTDVRERPAEPVPLHIRNAPTRLMKDLGYGAGYQYAHDAPDARVDQDDLPEALRGRQYYRPTDRGLETELGLRPRRVRRRRAGGDARVDVSPAGNAGLDLHHGRVPRARGGRVRLPRHVGAPPPRARQPRRAGDDHGDPVTRVPRLRVGVVFGGRSGEHEVSLASAASVITALE